jgi:hypothetical protein
MFWCQASSQSAHPRTLIATWKLFDHIYNIKVFLSTRCTCKYGMYVAFLFYRRGERCFNAVCAGIYVSLCNERRVQVDPTPCVRPCTVKLVSMLADTITPISLSSLVSSNTPVHGLVESRILVAHMHDFTFSNIENHPPFVRPDTKDDTQYKRFEINGVTKR